MIFQEPTLSGSVVLSGPLEILGSISASYFEGDGSGLTGLVAPVAVVQYTEVLGKPTLVSGSAQIDYNQIINVPDTVITASNSVINAPGHIIPTLNEQYDLGTASLRFRDLYLSGSTIFLGDTKLTRTVDGDLEIRDRISGNKKKVIVDELLIGSGSDAFKIKNINGRARFVKQSNEAEETETIATGSFTGTFTGNSFGVDTNNRLLFDAGHIKYIIGSTEEFRMSDTGDFHADGDIIGNSTTIASDINLKEDINIISNSLDKLNKLNGVEFTWKKDKKQSIGVIAQEVQEVFPQLVSLVPNLSNGEGEHLTVNYSGLIGVLIESVKDLQSQVTDLKNQLQELKDGTTD